jgi:hypothetical protein
LDMTEMIELRAGRRKRGAGRRAAAGFSLLDFVRRPGCS